MNYSTTAGNNLRAVDASAALRRAATASDANRTLRKAIIHGQLFSSWDFPAAEIQNVAADSPRPEIRVATMIDQLGPAPSDGSINDPASVELEQIVPLRSC